MRTKNEHTPIRRSHKLQEAALARLAEALFLATVTLADTARAHPVEQLRGAVRGSPPVARARQRAMYLSHIAGGLSVSAVGIAFGRDRATVRHACARCEDSRDSRAMDLALSWQEQALLNMAASLGLPISHPRCAASSLAGRG